MIQGPQQAQGWTWTLTTTVVILPHVAEATKIVTGENVTANVLSKHALCVLNILIKIYVSVIVVQDLKTIRLLNFK